MPGEHRRGILWAVASAFGIAAFVIPWKIAASHGSTATNTLVLLVAAAIFNSLLTVYRHKSIPRFSRFDLGVATALGSLTLLGNLASATAIKLISPALLTVVQRSEVIIVALLAWPIIGERIDRRFWAGAAIAICGLLLLNDPLAAADLRTTGIFWAVASAVCFGSMAVVTRKTIQRIDPVSVNGLRLWLAVMLWFIWNGFPPELAEISSAQVGYVSLAAFSGPFLGRLCLMNSAKYVEARITTLATLAAPVLTLVLGYLILSDLPTSREILGGTIMLIGISIPLLGLARARRARPPPSSEAS
ncbi:MAG: DMT family transporter [bacterium]|nr:DMT family transporter [bacterium]